MTWDEFKRHVDLRLAAEGHDGSVDIWYIDVGFPEAKVIGEEHGGIHEPSVGVSDMGMSIH